MALQINVLQTKNVPAGRSLALQTVPSDDDVIDLCSSEDELSSVPLPQLTSAAAQLPALAATSALVIKQESCQLGAVSATTTPKQVHAAVAKSKHKKPPTPALASRTLVQTPEPPARTSCLDQLPRTPAARKHLHTPGDAAKHSGAAATHVDADTSAKPAADAHKPAQPSPHAASTEHAQGAALPAANGNQTTAKTVDPQEKSGQQTAVHQKAGQACKPKPTGRNLEAMLQPRKGPSLQQLKESGLPPLPDRSPHTKASSRRHKPDQARQQRLHQGHQLKRVHSQPHQVPAIGAAAQPVTDPHVQAGEVRETSMCLQIRLSHAKQRRMTCQAHYVLCTLPFLSHRTATTSLSKQ